jgi:hypothetical protein
MACFGVNFTFIYYRKFVIWAVIFTHTTREPTHNTGYGPLSKKIKMLDALGAGEGLSQKMFGIYCCMGCV